MTTLPAPAGGTVKKVYCWMIASLALLGFARTAWADQDSDVKALHEIHVKIARIKKTHDPRNKEFNNNFIELLKLLANDPKSGRVSEIIGTFRPYFSYLVDINHEVQRLVPPKLENKEAQKEIKIALDAFKKRLVIEIVKVNLVINPDAHWEWAKKATALIKQDNDLVVTEMTSLGSAYGTLRIWPPRDILQE
jgi:hypothetical protein